MKSVEIGVINDQVFTKNYQEYAMARWRKCLTPLHFIKALLKELLNTMKTA